MEKKAVFHFGMVSRGKGQFRSAVDAAAYILGEQWESKYDGQTYDHSVKKEEVVYSAVLAPEGSPLWVFQPYTFVHAIEWSERKKNAQLLRSMYFSLPPEFSPEQQVALLSDYVQEVFVSAGMIALCAIHCTKEGHWNAHVLLSLRQLLPDGSFLPKAKGFPMQDEQGHPVLDSAGRVKIRKVCLTDWNDLGNGEKWRKCWADFTNKHYALLGFDRRIDHRSLKRQGLTQLSPVYVNPADHEAECRGERTEVGDLNRWIEQENQRRATYEVRKQAIDTLVDHYTTKMKQLGKRKQYRSPQTRATQQFFADVHRIEEQCQAGQVPTAPTMPPPSEAGHHAQAPRRERDPHVERE